jgi:hypothetical protein
MRKGMTGYPQNRCFVGDIWYDSFETGELLGQIATIESIVREIQSGCDGHFQQILAIRL